MAKSKALKTLKEALPSVSRQRIAITSAILVKFPNSSSL